MKREAVCARKDLYEAVQTVAHAVTGRSSLPILGHVLIHAEDGALRLTATDLELGISRTIPAKGIEVWVAVARTTCYLFA